jgi:hypothetical protein
MLSSDPPFRLIESPPEPLEPYRPSKLKADVYGPAAGFMLEIASRAPTALTRPDGRTIIGRGLFLSYHLTRVAVPWWFLASSFALAPTIALVRRRKSRRRPPHACPACGYDLRATADPAGPRLPACPECGRTTTA